MLQRAGFPDPEAQVRIDLPPPLNWTEPDFLYRLDEVGSFDAIAIYLDGMSGKLHGNPETADRDRQIRATLDERLFFQVVTIPFGHLSDRAAMASHFAKIARTLLGRSASEGIRAEPDAWFE
ncbi:hypothetical protein BH11ARM1_BH11ARM1_10320 [soil metagenome]